MSAPTTTSSTDIDATPSGAAEAEPQRIASRRLTLRPIRLEALRDLAESRLPAEFASVPDGALPPPHVALRALARLADGVPAAWSLPLLVIDRRDGSVVGGGAFKHRPEQGVVEIGYGIATCRRGEGIGTEAVALMLAWAAATGEVGEVVAMIVPGNLPSERLVARLGFVAGATLADADGETVVRWAYRISRQ